MEQNRTKSLPRVPARIEQHVGERIPDLPRSTQDPYVIPICEDRTPRPEDPIHGPRESGAERLHSPPKSMAVRRFDDQVGVIAL